MTTATTFTVTHRPTGRRVVGEVKTAWGRHYYSFDRATWHASKVTAFRTAEAAGTLLTDEPASQRAGGLR